jgi:hypothetical protein
LPDIPVAQRQVLDRARAALRRPRTALALEVAALLVVALVSVALSGALALANSGARTIILPGAVVTATPQSDASATVIAGATPSAQATAFATQAPNPTATSAPLPALTITPTPLALTPLPNDTHMQRHADHYQQHVADAGMDLAEACAGWFPFPSQQRAAVGLADQYVTWDCAWWP